MCRVRVQFLHEASSSVSFKTSKYIYFYQQINNNIIVPIISLSNIYFYFII